MLSPLILTNIVYTIVDYFIAPTNKIVANIRSASFGSLSYGIGSAMSWIYFAIVGLILVIVFMVFSRFVFTMNDYKGSRRRMAVVHKQVSKSSRNTM